MELWKDLITSRLLLVIKTLPKANLLTVDYFTTWQLDLYCSNIYMYNIMILEPDKMEAKATKLFTLSHSQIIEIIVVKVWQACRPDGLAPPMWLEG